VMVRSLKTRTFVRRLVIMRRMTQACLNLLRLGSGMLTLGLG
jgi:hypothetical protein